MSTGSEQIPLALDQFSHGRDASAQWPLPRKDSSEGEYGAHFLLYIPTLERGPLPTGIGNLVPSRDVAPVPGAVPGCRDSFLIWRDAVSDPGADHFTRTVFI